MANSDLEELLNALFPFAQQMLSKHGEFYPFGASMSPDGEIFGVVGADIGDEHPKSQALIDFMTEAFREEAAAGQIRAAGICTDVLTVPPGQTDKTDAICASLEHRSGEAMDLYMPYKKDLLGKYKFGEVFATERTPEFFVQGGTQA